MRIAFVFCAFPSITRFSLFLYSLLGFGCGGRKGFFSFFDIQKDLYRKQRGADHNAYKRDQSAQRKPSGLVPHLYRVFAAGDAEADQAVAYGYDAVFRLWIAVLELFTIHEYHPALIVGNGGKYEGVCVGNLDFTGKRLLLVEDNEVNREKRLTSFRNLGQKHAS